MATQLDSLIDRQRRADIAANAAALGEPALRTFHVEILTGQSVASSFEAMGADNMTVAKQYRRLCGPGQHVRATALPTEEELIASDLAYLHNRRQRDAERQRRAVEEQVNFFRCVGAL